MQSKLGYSCGRWPSGSEEWYYQNSYRKSRKHVPATIDWGSFADDRKKRDGREGEAADADYLHGNEFNGIDR